MRGHEPQERGAVARVEREPADDAEDQPVEGQREHRPDPEQRSRRANAVSVTWMLLVSTSVENAAPSAAS